MKLQINIAKLSNSELVSFGDQLNTFIKDLNGIDGVLLPFQEKLTLCQQAINNVLQKTMAKDVSAQLKTEDNLRDNCIIGLNKLVEACEYHPDETVKEAAIKLNDLLDKMGNKIYLQSYDAESTIIKTLLTELNGEYSSHIALVNATPFVTALSEAQTRFDTYRQHQLTENAEVSEIVSMSAIRREFEQDVRNLFQLLPSYYLINQSAQVKTAINQVQELINKFN